MYTIKGQDELKQKLIDLEGRLLDICVKSGVVENHDFYITKTFKMTPNLYIGNVKLQAANDIRPCVEIDYGVTGFVFHRFTVEGFKSGQ